MKQNQNVAQLAGNQDILGLCPSYTYQKLVEDFPGRKLAKGLACFSIGKILIPVQ